MPGTVPPPRGLREDLVDPPAPLPPPELRVDDSRTLHGIRRRRGEPQHCETQDEKRIAHRKPPPRRKTGRGERTTQAPPLLGDSDQVHRELTLALG